MHSLSLPRFPADSSRRLRLRAPLPAGWPPTLAWMAATGLCVLVALASLPLTVWSAPALPPLPAMAAAAAPQLPATAARRARCAQCGVVERIRLLQPVGLIASEYEFTVRMRDRSARVSTVTAATAAAWTVGDTIQLIGGV